MAKAKTAYVCNQCGAEHTKWQGQCESCGAWNTLSEFVLEAASKAGAVRRSGYSGGAAHAQIVALTQIATETGGRYYRAKDNESLKGIYDEINQLEKSKIEVSNIRRYTEQFFPFALAAAICLLLELLLRWTLLRKFP